MSRNLARAAALGVALVALFAASSRAGTLVYTFGGDLSLPAQPVFRTV